MKKLIDLLRMKLGFWLIQTKTLTATATMLEDRVNQTRCIHCGKNPYFKDSSSMTWGPEQKW